MPLFLGHTTAARLLEAPGIEFLSHAVDAPFDCCLASREQIGEIDLSPLFELTDIRAPLDVLVSSRSQIRHWEKIACHLCPDNLPSGAFLELTSDIFIASPELCFVLRARELSLARTIRMGCGLCGSYARSRNHRIVERTPITTPERLETFARHCVRVAGSPRAIRAVRWVLPYAASPMEGPCAMPFYLPRRMGGFGLPMPILNYEVPLKGPSRAMVEKSHIAIDVCWPDAGWGLEYQGEENHGRLPNIRNDIGRQLAAESCGYELQMMTIEQLRNPHQRLFVATKTAQRLGIDLRVDEHLMSANQRLVDDMLTDISEPF